MKLLLLFCTNNQGKTTEKNSSRTLLSKFCRCFSYLLHLRILIVKQEKNSLIKKIETGERKHGSQKGARFSQKQVSAQQCNFCQKKRTILWNLNVTIFSLIFPHFGINHLPCKRVFYVSNEKSLVYNLPGAQFKLNSC